jgi:hypothetical protein
METTKSAARWPGVRLAARQRLSAALARARCAVRERAGAGAFPGEDPALCCAAWSRFIDASVALRDASVVTRSAGAEACRFLMIY